MSKKVLYIKAQWLGDIIWGLPFLIQQKKLGNKVYQTFYDMRHLNKGLDKQSEEIQKKYKSTPMYGGWHHILEGLKKNKIIEEILIIPFGKWNILKFLIKNFNKYDEAVIPVKTPASQFLGFLLAKKSHYIFTHINDISKYRILADGEHGWNCPALYNYEKYIQFPMETIKISDEYITIFPSIYERSLDIEEWIDIINFVQSQGFKVVIVGWNREKWFMEELGKYEILSSPHIVNMLDKTSLAQLSYVLKKAKCCISGNGGPMRIANLMNPKCINIHTVSSFIMEPPVDNINSFNLRPYKYPQCQPCEASSSTAGKCGIEECVFYSTVREGECRKIFTSLLIKKHLLLII